MAHRLPVKPVYSAKETDYISENDILLNANTSKLSLARREQDMEHEIVQELYLINDQIPLRPGAWCIIPGGAPIYIMHDAHLDSLQNLGAFMILATTDSDLHSFVPNINLDDLTYLIEGGVEYKGLALVETKWRKRIEGGFEDLPMFNLDGYAKLSLMEMPKL